MRYMIRPGVANVSFIIALGALIAVQMPGFANDPGLGWHLATGEWILRNRAIPRYDPFLQFPEARLWISDQWLSDLVFFSLYTIGGWALLYAFIAAVFSGTFLLLLYENVRRSSGLYIASAVSALYAFKIAQVHFIIRPVVMSFLFFAAVYLLLMSLLRRIRSGSFRLDSWLLRSELMLGLLFAVWANAHPSFVLGLLLVAVWTCVLLLFFLLRLGITAKIAGNALLAFAVSAAATLINPYGISLHKSILALGQSRFFMGLHEEWKSPNLAEYDGQLFLAGGILVLTSLLLSASARRRIGTFSVLLWLLFLAGSVDAVRMLPYFGIVSVMPLTLIAGIIASRLRFRLPHATMTLRRRMLRLERMERKSFPAAKLVEIFIAAIFMCGLLGKIPFQPPFLGPSPNLYPYEAVSALMKKAEGDKPLVIISHPNWGGFITWYGRGRLRPVIDDRNTLIGESFYEEYFERLKNSEASAESLLKELNSRFLLLSADSPLAGRLLRHEEFRVIFKDDKSIVVEWAKAAAAS